MSVSVVFAIAGGIALIVGIIGGGVKAKEIEVPLLSIESRIISIIAGVILIGFSIWLVTNNSLANLSASSLQTSTPSSNGLSGAGPSTSTPTPPNLQTVTPMPTPTAANLNQLYSKLYEAKTWNSVLYDTFDQNNHNWTMWNVDDNLRKETMQIANGVLSWGLQLKTPDQYYGEIAPVFSYSDFYLSVRIRRIGGTTTRNQAGWGIFFRRKGEDFYAFRIDDAQEYFIQTHNQDGWKDLVGGTKSALVEPDRFNELTVIAEGSDLCLFLNGAPIEMINDVTYPNGNIGLIAGLNFVDNEETLFQYDEFDLRQKP